MKNKPVASPKSERQQRFLDCVGKLKMRFPVADIAEKMRKPQTTVATNLNDREVSKGFLRSFCDVFGFDYEYIDKGVQPENDKPEDMIDNKQDQGISGSAIDSLLAINKVYADAHRDLTEAHLRAIQNNTDLTAMLKEKVATDSSEQLPAADFETKIGKLLLYIAEVGAGKAWPTVKDGVGILHKRFHDVEHPMKAVGSTGGGHR